MSLGAGRKVKGGTIDKTAGINFNFTVGDHVDKGDVLGTLMTSSDCDMEEAEKEFLGIFSISEEPVESRTPVLKIIR